MSTPTDQDVRERIDAVAHWYHQIEIRPGIVTPGVNPSAVTLRHLELPDRCDGHARARHRRARRLLLLRARAARRRGRGDRLHGPGRDRLPGRARAARLAASSTSSTTSTGSPPSATASSTSCSSSACSTTCATRCSRSTASGTSAGDGALAGRRDAAARQRPPARRRELRARSRASTRERRADPVLPRRHAERRRLQLLGAELPRCKRAVRAAGFEVDHAEVIGTRGLVHARKVTRPGRLYQRRLEKTTLREAAAAVHADRRCRGRRSGRAAGHRGGARAVDGVGRDQAPAARPRAAAQRERRAAERAGGGAHADRRSSRRRPRPRRRSPAASCCGCSAAACAPAWGVSQLSPRRGARCAPRARASAAGGGCRRAPCPRAARPRRRPGVGREASSQWKPRTSGGCTG